MGADQSWVEALIREYLNRLKRSIDVEGVIVFGSRARGDFYDSSDLDLIVVSPSFKDKTYEERYCVLIRMWRNYDKLRLNAFGYTWEELQEARKTSPFISKAFSDGVLEVYRKGRPPYAGRVIRSAD